MIKPKSLASMPLQTLALALAIAASSTAAHAVTLVEKDGSYAQVPLEKDKVVIKVVQNLTRNLQDFPTIEQGLMKSAGWVMSDGRHLATVQVASRAAGGIYKDKWIGPIPLPLADRWLQARDVEAPPTQTFRQWWKNEHEEGTR